MKRCVPGRATSFRERLDDCIGEDNPVQVVDVFVEELALRDLGFTRVDPLAGELPAHHPAVLLKRDIYGYLNRVQSGRGLEHAQLATTAGKAREGVGSNELTAIADRGYCNRLESLRTGLARPSARWISPSTLIYWPSWQLT